MNENDKLLQEKIEAYEREQEALSAGWRKSYE